MAEKAPSIRVVRRTDCIRLDAEDTTYFTEEGYLHDRPILTSVGIFEYHDPNAKGGIRRELRLPKYVFEEESLKSYRGKPVIITHRGGEVNKDNVSDRQIGTILSDGYKDGDDVRAEVMIHDTDAMKRCGFKELSLGYTLDLVEEPGEYQGQHYDGIQTNIRVNHLALVEAARAGETARLNIDSKDEDINGIEHLEGGRVVKRKNMDSKAMTPDELKGAIGKLIEQYTGAGEATEEGVPAPAKEAEAVKPVPPVQEKKEAAKDAEPVAAEEQKPAVQATAATPEAPVQTDGGDLAGFLAALEELIAKFKGEQNTDGKHCDEEDPTLGTEENPIIDEEITDAEGEEGEETTLADLLEEDEEDVTGEGVIPGGDNADKDASKALNTDSVDDIVSKKLEIGMIGRRLNMDGLERKSITDGKKAIINKVIPGIRLDGKSAEYIDAQYDVAKALLKNNSGTNYQRQQMMNGAKAQRFDGNESQASAARRKMIERTGGNN